jgi:ferredoxin
VIFQSGQETKMAIAIKLDIASCQGYACCMMEAPNLFELDDDTSKAVLLHDQIDEAGLARARAAERACPARAITVTVPDSNS